MSLIKGILILTLLLLPLVAEADNKATIIGKKSVTVVGSAVTLGDIADISNVNNDALSKIEIASAPAPGEEISLEASQVLQALKENGINLSDIGYALPKNLKVARAARLISLAEVREALENNISESGRNLTISEIEYREPVKVAPGFATITAKLNSRSKARMVFDITVQVDSEEPKSFDVSAQVSEWADVPVASRPLRRGEIIEKGDLQMARLNLEALAEDITITEDDLVGKELKQPISVGETFKARNIKVPPVILSSSKITAIYESGALRAVATAIALEDGVPGQMIRIQNEISKKTLMARVVEPGLVRVEREVLR
jgi:flagella basal body P-ring formation protein FlgA